MPQVESIEIDWEYEDYREPLSIHIVDAADARVLVGGGDPTIAESVAAVARERWIDAVLAEHGHIDHYGAIPTLQSKLDPEVAVPARDAPVLREAGIVPDRLLEPGDSYHGIEAVAAPGHTPGNMAYRYEDVLFAGDTVVGADSEFAASGPWSGQLAMIEPRFNDDDRQARESVTRLLEVTFETVRVSHGSHVLEDGMAAVERLVSDLEV